MTDYMEQVICVIAAWNLVTFLLYGLDKRRAVRGKFRISERTLILVSFFMGGVGSLLGMSVFRHKTKHLKFRILVPVAVICNVLIVVGYVILKI